MPRSADIRKALVLVECNETFENTALSPWNDQAKQPANAARDSALRESVLRVASLLERLVWRCSSFWYVPLLAP
jgi:hypothetical protein